MKCFSSHVRLQVHVPARETPQKKGIFFIDKIVKELLVFPPGTPLHNHSWVQKGMLVLQDKASCLPAYVMLHAIPLDSKLDKKRDEIKNAHVGTHIMEVCASVPVGRRAAVSLRLCAWGICAAVLMRPCAPAPPCSLPVRVR